MLSPQRMQEEVVKVKRAVEELRKKFEDKLPPDLGFVFALGIIREREPLITKVKFVTQEMGINVVPGEKAAIYGFLHEKYKKEDRENQKDQKKLFLKQVKEIKAKKKKLTNS